MHRRAAVSRQCIGDSDAHLNGFDTLAADLRGGSDATEKTAKRQGDDKGRKSLARSSKCTHVNDLLGVLLLRKSRCQSVLSAPGHLKVR